MDPKKIAEEIMQSLFASNEELYEADQNEEEGEEEEGEEEEGEEGPEHEQQEPAGHEEAEAKKNGGMVKNTAGSAAASVAMKPTGNMAAASSMGGGEVVRDAHGGSTHDAYGKGDTMIQPVAQPGMSQNAAATLQMKPSWAGVQMPTFDRGQMAEEVKAMFGGAEDLSEEFVNKAANLYEARLLTNLQEITEQLSEQFANKLVESVETVATTLEEQVDNYLNYVVEQWMTFRWHPMNCTRRGRRPTVPLKSHRLVATCPAFQPRSTMHSAPGLSGRRVPAFRHRGHLRCAAPSLWCHGRR